MRRKRVVITGMGAVSPLGNNVPEMSEHAFAGVCGIGEITSFDASGHKVSVAAEVKDFDPSSYFDKMEARRTARFTQFAVAASMEAFRQSGLDMEKEDPVRCSVYLSSGIGGLGIIEREHSRGQKRGFDMVSPLFVPMAITNMAAGLTAIRLGFRGSCSCIVTACASASNAIGEAFHALRDGYAGVILAGGTESCITELGIGGFTSMRALSEAKDPARASIPFDKERAGFVMGEGAGVLMMETYDHAVARGAEILGEIVGYGASCDAHHMTAPREDGEGAADAMCLAMEDAAVSPQEIGYINAHGTGTPLNDRCETRAVRKAFGEAAEDLVMSSTKSMMGHALGASGGLESILTVEALRKQMAPPTINYQVPDPDCDLDIAPGKAKAFQGEYAMSNSLGFGGHNASLVFRRAE